MNIKLAAVQAAKVSIVTAVLALLFGIYVYSFSGITTSVSVTTYIAEVIIVIAILAIIAFVSTLYTKR